VLGAIGIEMIAEVPGHLTKSGGDAFGYGEKDKAYFWIGGNERAGQRTHVAFALESRALVEAFHAAGLAAGGLDNGGPGLRPHYHPNYYSAFILDPDGMNAEAVCYSPE
jgi:catechol 2,3-dioxygenase-like lactoylglutathione lyase family enzyme